MLRSVKSLSSVRAFNNAFKPELVGQKCSHSITKCQPIISQIPQYVETQQQQTRSVHSTAKKQTTTLLNSRKSDFALMSLKALKSECKRRGLKVSGRKADLVSRVQSYEDSFSSAPSHALCLSTAARPEPCVNETAAALFNKKHFAQLAERQFSQTATGKAKGDGSHIDYIKPVDMEPPSDVDEEYIVKIPSISTEASKKPVTKLEKELFDSANQGPEQTIVSKAEGSDSKIFEQGSLDGVNEQNAKAEVLEYEDLAKNRKSEESEPYEWENGEVSKRDKTLLSGALAVVTGLFVLKWMSKDKKKRSSGNQAS